METPKTVVSLPIEQIIDIWLLERGVQIVWSSEKLVLEKGDLWLDLEVDDIGDIEVQNTMFFMDKEEFLAEYGVKRW